MPLDTPYGVIVGSLHDYDLVNPDSGQWPHYHVRLSANGQVIDSAINLKSLTQVKIEYRRRQFSIHEPVFVSVVALSNGLHKSEHFRGALEAVFAAAGHHLQHYRLERGGDVTLLLARPGDLGFADLGRDLLERAAGERRLAGEQGEGDDSEGIQVAVGSHAPLRHGVTLP